LLIMREVVHGLHCERRSRTEITAKMNKSELVIDVPRLTTPAYHEFEECVDEDYWCAVEVQRVDEKVFYNQGCARDFSKGTFPICLEEYIEDGVQCICKEDGCNTFDMFYKKPSDETLLPKYTYNMEQLDELGVLYHETLQRFFIDENFIVPDKKRCYTGHHYLSDTLSSNDSENEYEVCKSADMWCELRVVRGEYYPMFKQECVKPQTGDIPICKINDREDEVICACMENDCNTLEKFYKKPVHPTLLPAYTQAIEGLKKLGIIYDETAQNFYVEGDLLVNVTT
ncbi:hypothetical protein PFISCL1PPCAC_21107, partial [Pristionchus fissidentatus]